MAGVSSPSIFPRGRLCVGAIGWEAIQRLLHPEPVASVTVIVVAALGIFINGITA
jgi:cobalt-zinc-cadmium efflux system protein